MTKSAAMKSANIRRIPSRRSNKCLADMFERHDTPPVTPPVDEKKKRLIQALKDTPLGTSELLKALHIRDRNYLREGYIRPTMRAGFIEQTRPDVKHSKLQKYRLTEKGRAALKSTR